MADYSKHARNPFETREQAERMAANYEKVVRLFIPGYEATFDMARVFLELSLPEQAEVLVVGARGGKELITFGAARTGWRFVGVDPSAQMIEAAGEKVKQHGLSERVELVQGLAHELRADKLFVAATCILVMHFVPDDGAKLDLLKQIPRRLKPHAKLVLVDGCEDVGLEQFKLFFEAYRQHAELAGATAEYLELAVKNINEYLHVVPQERLRAFLREAGFSGVFKFYTALWFRGWFISKD